MKKEDRSRFYYGLDHFADIEGGSTKLTVLLQKRTRELIKGLPRLVDIDSDDPVRVALEELFQGKITLSKIPDELELNDFEDDNDNEEVQVKEEVQVEKEV